MGTTCNAVLRYAFSAGFRLNTEADGATVSVKLLDANGDPTGSNLILDGAAATAPAMTQYEPGKFTYTVTGSPLTRGKKYRATYTVTLGGTTAETGTQDFTAYSSATEQTAPSTANTYTLLDLREIVRKVLGIMPATNDQGLDAQEPGSDGTIAIVNDECESVWRAHRWTFQMGDSKYGQLIANCPKYQLPIDFMELKSIVKPNQIAHRYKRETWEKIRELRERAVVAPPLITYYTVVSDPPADLSAVTRYALEVWPTPAAFEDNGYVIDYYREYPRMNTDADVCPFPVGFHSAIKQCVRAAAMESENDPEAPKERAKAEAMLARAAQHDGRHNEMNLGSMVDRDKSSWDLYEPEASHDPYSVIKVS